MDLSGVAAPFSWVEIVEAINKAPNNRSPGPNGFTNEFYKVFKHLLKHDVIKFFEDLHNNNINLDGINTAYITLLPKKDAPLEIKDHRPISLVHSMPKLASKVMKNRLQRQIPALVHSLQSGFLKVCSIVENFALAAELIKCAHKRKLRVIALKLDFHKAFDSVNWDYLKLVMEARGFPQPWRQWVSNLLSSGHSRVMIKGELPLHSC